MLVATLALALVLGAPPPSPEPPPIEVLDAGRLDYDVTGQKVTGTGGIVIRRGLVIIHAAQATYDSQTGVVDASGGVLLTEPGRAVTASALHAVLDGPYHASDVVAYLKEGPLDLAACRTVDEARTKGLNRVTLHGGEVDGDAHAPATEIRDAVITFCDCGAGPPSWEVRSRSASVIPNDHAWLRWPVIYVTPFWHRRDGLTGEDPNALPVLALPALYLPLTDRQTGLLFPQYTAGGPSGSSLAQPVFVTLGRSWDTTITPIRYFGSENGRVKGWGADLELRWAPSENASGRARVSLAQGGGDWPSGVARPLGGKRVAFSLLHDQKLSDAAYLKLDLGLVGDPLYTTDFTADALLRVVEYRRNAAALTWRSSDLVAGAWAAYHLPLIDLDACPGATCSPAPFGLFGLDVPVFHRLPSTAAVLLPTRLAGPVTAEASADLSRFAPIQGSTGGEDANGFGPGEHNWPSGAAGGDLSVQRIEAVRTVARGELRAPFTLGGVVGVEPRLTGTGTAYALAAGQGTIGQARLSGGLSLWSELARTFGEKDAPRHVVQPRLLFAAGTGGLGGGLPNYAYDEFDVAAPLPGPSAGAVYVPVRRTLSAVPGGGFAQAQVSVRNAVTFPRQALSVELTLGQDLDLDRARLSESFATWALRWHRLSVDANARFYAFGAHAPEGSGPVTTSPALPASLFDDFTLLQLGAMLTDPRGDNVHAGILTVAAGGSPRLLAGLEPIFDARAVAFDAVAQGNVGAVGKLSGATFSYEATFYARELASAPCAGKSTSPHIYQHAVGVTWDSPCHCWKLGVVATINECLPEPQYQFLVDLSSLANVAH